MHTFCTYICRVLSKNEVVVLSSYYFDCKTLYEISHELDIPLNTVKSIFYRAREKIYKHFNINLTRKTVERKIDHFIQEDKIVYQW